MKKVISILFVIIVVCIFLNQWDQFITKEQKVNAEESAQSKITIRSDEQSVNINQTISLLSDDVIYEVKVPKHAVDWTCTYENKDKCEGVWGAEDILKSKGSVLHFTYTLPINKKNITMVHDWLFQLSGVTIDHIDIKIIESHQRKGQWITGVPLSGFVEEKLIDYYFFSGPANNPSLVWQPDEIPSEQTAVNYALYGEQSEKLREIMRKHEGEMPATNFLSILTTDQLKSGRFENIIVLPTGETMERELVKSLYLHSIEHEGKEWFLDLLTSFIINEKPNFALGKHAYDELTNKLSLEEMELLVNKVSHLDADFVPEDMDEVIYEITGKQTNFFKETLKSNQSLSLELFTMKNYYWDNKESRVKIIELAGVEWLPLQKTMSFLEFETERLTETEWAIFKGEDVYRFYSDQAIFIRNEEVFGLLAHPLKKMNGEYYIEKKWLQSIFNIQYIEENNDIHFMM